MSRMPDCLSEDCGFESHRRDQTPSQRLVRLPYRSINKKEERTIYAFLAQLVEQLAVNQWVGGPSPSEGAKALQLVENSSEACIVSWSEGRAESSL